MTRKTAMIAEAMLVGALGAAIGAVLFSDWFLACCRPVVTGWAGALFSPAMIIGMFVGGGASRATAFDSSVGVVIELMIIWAAFRWIIRCSRRKQHSNRP